MVAENKVGRCGTGGGPLKEYTFSTLENRIVELLKIRSGLAGKGISFGVAKPSVLSSSAPGFQVFLPECR